MGSSRAIIAFMAITLCGALVYLLAVNGEDPLRGPDPRICAATQSIPTDRVITDAALGQVIANQQAGGIAYPSIEALRASEPHIRFSSDWTWQRWQTDRTHRISLARSGLQYAYTVSVAYRRQTSGAKPYAVETYRLDECANPIGDGLPISTGAWSETLFQQAQQTPGTVPVS